MNAKKSTTWRQWRSWVVAICCCAICALIWLKSFPIVFGTNDDFAIQMILSGSMSGGQPEPHAVYINYALGEIIAFLFKVVPGIPWWFILHVVVLSMAIILFNYSISEIMRSIKASPAYENILIICLLLILDISIFSYPFLRIQFTLTPAIAIGSAIFNIPAIVLGEKSKTEQYILKIYCLILILFACMIRIQSGLLGLIVYFIFYIGICFIKHNGPQNNLRKGFCCVKENASYPLIIVISILFLMGSNNLAYQTEDWEAFSRINSERSEFMDYPHSTYDEKPYLYQEAGWSKSEYDLTRRWCFMTEAASSSAFEAINQNDSLQKHSEAIEWLSSWFWRTGIYSSLDLVILTTFFLIFSISGCTISRNPIIKIIQVLILLVTLAEFTYLSVIGRLIGRVAYACLFPAAMASAAGVIVDKKHIKQEEFKITYGTRIISMLVLSVISIVCIASALFQIGGLGRLFYCLLSAYFVVTSVYIFGYKDGEKEKKNREFKTIIIFVLAISVIACPAVIKKFSLSDLTTSEQVKNNIAHANLTEYLGKQSKYTYIVPTIESSSTNPIITSAPDNVFSWGGWPYYLPFQQEQINRAVSGNKPLSLLSLVTQDNVRLVTSDENNVNLVKEYLSQETSKEVLVKADESIGIYTIYQFCFLEDGTEWRL